MKRFCEIDKSVDMEIEGDKIVDMEIEGVFKIFVKGFLEEKLVDDIIDLVVEVDEI